MLRVACQANSEVDPEKAKKVKTSKPTYHGVSGRRRYPQKGGKYENTQEDLSHPNIEKLSVAACFLHDG